MFSYTINNPNNLLIQDNSYFIPIGHRCTSALACKYANLRKFSLPFDWSIPLFPKKIKNVLENDFKDFLPDFSSNNIYNKYNFRFPHFNNDIDKGKEEYKRRIDRFNEIINQGNKIYFIYINEDYLYNEIFRNNEFNDEIFNDMLELEDFIKHKYTNIDYNILYFNFKQDNIPINSNIINIVLNSTEMSIDKTVEFRHYCGKILSELFNSEFNIIKNPDFYN